MEKAKQPPDMSTLQVVLIKAMELSKSRKCGKEKPRSDSKLKEV